jgi:transcriptional regulator with XRE-family HTH domain
MVKLRKIIAENIRTYRKEMGISQFKLASMINSAPNYIAMIEAEKRFPTDSMLEKIAAALDKEPCELFMFKPIQKEWQKTILTEISDLITEKLNEV